MPKSRVVRGNRHSEAIDPRVEVVLHAIETRLGDPQLTPNQLAALVQLSPPRLRQLMRCEFAHGVKQHIDQRRMVRARRLLQASFMPVKEVMTLVGVRDSSHFSKNYKKHFGVSPREDRLQMIAISSGRSSCV
jgi:transcriptional regulator GlxA family with amidase domain